MPERILVESAAKVFEEKLSIVHSVLDERLPPPSNEARTKAFAVGLQHHSRAVAELACGSDFWRWKQSSANASQQEISLLSGKIQGISLIQPQKRYKGPFSAP